MSQGKQSLNSKLELLKELGSIKLGPTPDSYWRKEEVILKKLYEKQKKLNDSMKMSHEMFVKKFDV